MKHSLSLAKSLVLASYKDELDILVSVCVFLNTKSASFEVNLQTLCRYHIPTETYTTYLSHNLRKLLEHCIWVNLQGIIISKIKACVSFPFSFHLVCVSSMLNAFLLAYLSPLCSCGRESNFYGMFLSDSFSSWIKCSIIS